jgi:hypothetical protein
VGKAVGKDKEDLSRQAATIMQTGTFAPEDLLYEIIKLQRLRAEGERRA